MENYYEVLGTSSSATREELKKCYHRMALEYHPDKQCEKEHKFCKLDEAWKILGNEKKRKEYDAKLKAGEIEYHHPLHEELLLTEMDWNSNTNQYERYCRCGGKYIIPEEDVSHDLISVGCDTCSLNVVVDCNNSECKKATDGNS